MVTQGRVTLSELAVIEGSTFNQLRAILNANPAVRHDTTTLSEAEIMQRLGAMEGAAEGLFFPDTYYFASGASDLALLKRAYQTMQKHLWKNWQGRAQDLRLKRPIRH